VDLKTGANVQRTEPQGKSVGALFAERWSGPEVRVESAWNAPGYGDRLLAILKQASLCGARSALSRERLKFMAEDSSIAVL